MTVTYDTPSADDLEELCLVDARNFGAPLRAVDLDRARNLLELDRFVVARDHGAIVAVAGSYRLELTVAGGGRLPMSGLAWVSVTATHRRQGINRRLLSLMADQAAARGEPILGLTASEGGIYERFGYGAATWRRSVVIDRRRVELAAPFRPEPGGVTIVEPRSSLDRFLAVFERYRRRQPGEINRPRGLFEWYLPEPGEAQLLAGASHEDGFAIWTVDQNWAEGDPAHRMQVLDLIAVTPQAHRALWHTVLSTDLVGEIRTRTAVAPDDPLPFFLTDPRALRTEALADHLWLKVIDPVAAFAARSYRTDDTLVIGVDPGGDLDPAGAAGTGHHATTRTPAAFRVGSRGNTVEVEPSTEPPDVTAAPSALGPLLLGGVSASALAAGGRLRAERAVLDRAGAFFGVDPLPHCRSGF
jgi:predicted acetyltransferase